MKKVSNAFTQILNILMAIALSIMAILVFGNVILRYLFNSGITWSEEAARFLFVWLTFLGAISALKDNEHLGVDFMVRKLSPKAKTIVYVLSNGIVLYVLWLVLYGSWKMTLLNWTTKSPAMGIPMSFIYVVGIIMAVNMAIIVICRIFQVIFHMNSLNDLQKKGEIEEKLTSYSTSSHQFAAEEGGK